MRFLLLCALLALHGLVSAQEDYCFGKDQERTQTRQFTSKTAYQIIKGTNIDKQYQVPKCEPIKMWIFHRHGTRLPTPSTIEAAPRLEELRDLIVKNYRVLRTQPDTNALCKEDQFGIQMWRWNSSITVDIEEHLTRQGYEDLRGTAKLYQRYYPQVLTKNYNDTYYLFRHTDTQRTTESFKAFAEGLFGENNPAHAVDIPDEDLLLRPYDYCTAYKEQNYKGPDSDSYKYRQSALWNNTLTDISRRLGFQYTLSADDILLMYDMCRYEQAWQVDRTSVWCAAFLPEQVTVLEYEDDLKYYYKSGYGYEDNSRLNCRAVKDMLSHLSSPASPHVVAYFGHSTGLQTLITALGINKDDLQLKADNYNSLTSRRWKTSNIDPFAGNFVAVKYACPTDLEKEKVVFFLNQNAVQLDWCNVGLCNWSEVQQRYKNLADANCDEYYCRSSAAKIATHASLLIAAIVYLMH
ncbi:multiple inositol polyphosphate phosphatase 1 [Scaptodrosophila lebanonensis]|uniref:Multiple inositol polyphosphate phosphatase 1 n=1 Tax=Drosophila lebanonensis TaxID=7225 RepID=A0A6J2TYJ4_DROLE|nr:multiple inositol polyphosphate phosphatase 1 [Scaptodrosophila lebanonensis]XP_030380203.1 multiple inositol polyphosphate phosphatase 1 [Scaptodrosophila lebanonensis]